MGDKEKNARELVVLLKGAFPDLEPALRWRDIEEMALYKFFAHPDAELQIPGEVFRKSNTEIVAALQENNLVQKIQATAGCYRLRHVNDDLVLLPANPFPPRS